MGFLGLDDFFGEVTRGGGDRIFYRRSGKSHNTAQATPPADFFKNPQFHPFNRYRWLAHWRASAAPRAGWPGWVSQPRTQAPVKKLESEMKTMRVISKWTAAPAHAVRVRTAALIATVAIGICPAVQLKAAVIDDFEDGVKFAEGGGGTNYFRWGLTNGQMLISRQNPIPTPRHAVDATYDNVYWPAPPLPAGNLAGGRTLEVRTDLNQISADDLFLMLMAGGPTAGEDSAYIVFVDRNEVALAKYKITGMTTFYWDTLATTSENVTVRLAFTKRDGSLVITVKVEEKGQRGATLYERSFVDGPGRDGPVSPPDPHGYGFFVPDNSGPLTNFTYTAVGCSQMIFSQPPPLQMLLDNLEYDVNRAPVADASASQTIYISPNGVDATVLLAGSRSSDPDGDVLEYLWYAAPPAQPATLLASGEVATAILPVGTHPIELVVNDGLASATNALTVEVITATEAVERLMAQVTESWSRAWPLRVTLHAARQSIERGNTISAVNQLQAFQNKARTQVAPRNPILAASFVQAAQEIIDALNGGGRNPDRLQERFVPWAE